MSAQSPTRCAIQRVHVRRRQQPVSILGFQGWGAWLILGLSALWVGRAQFAAYFKRAFKGDPTA